MKKTFRPLFLLFFFCLPIITGGQQTKDAEKYTSAFNLEQSGEYEKAKEIYLELLNKTPGDYNYFYSLNRIYTILKDYSSSVELIENRINTSPKDYNLYGLLGNACYLQGKIENAYASWKSGLMITPPSAAAFRTIASYATANRAYDKAVEFYQMGEAQLKNPGLFFNEIFNLQNALQKYSEAAELLCEAILKQPGNIGIGKSIFYTYSSKPEMADKYIEVINRYSGRGEIGTFKELLAFIYLMKKENQKALDIIKELGSSEERQNSIFILAQDCFVNKNYEASALIYKYLTGICKNTQLLMQSRIYYPRSLELMINAASSSEFKKNGTPDSSLTPAYRNAIGAYEETAAAYPKSETGNDALLRIGIIQKEILFEPDAAEKTFSKILENNIISLTRFKALEYKAEIFLLNNKLSEGEKLLNEALTAPFADAGLKKRAGFYLGKKYFWSGEFKKALEYLNEPASAFGDDLSNDALELSSLIGTCKSDSSYLAAYAGADYLIFRGKYADAMELLKTAQKSENLILSDAARYLYAENLVNLSLYPESLKIMEEIFASGNSNYADNAYFSAGNIYFYRIKDFKNAKNCFEKLLALFPDSIFADKAREMINTIKNKSEIKNDN